MFFFLRFLKKAYANIVRLRRTGTNRRFVRISRIVFLYFLCVKIPHSLSPDKERSQENGLRGFAPKNPSFASLTRSAKAKEGKGLPCRPQFCVENCGSASRSGDEVIGYDGRNDCVTGGQTYIPKQTINLSSFASPRIQTGRDAGSDLFFP